MNRKRKFRLFSMVFIASTSAVSPDSRGKFTPPANLRKYARLLTDKASVSHPVVMVPHGRVLFIANPHSLQTSTGLRDALCANPSVLGRPLADVLRSHRVYPARPFYEAARPSERLMSAKRALEEAESSGRLAELTGKQFESLVKEVLEAVGLTVQQNLRLEGADIDLLFCLARSGKPEFVMVECKHQAKSGKPASISQVLRLYGLREAVRAPHGFDNAVIISSTGLSPSARAFCTTYNLGGYTLGGFLEWAAQSVETADERLPVFRVVTHDSRGRLRIPSAFMPGLGAEGIDSLVMAKWPGRSLMVCSEEDFSETIRELRKQRLPEWILL